MTPPFLIPSPQFISYIYIYIYIKKEIRAEGVRAPVLYSARPEHESRSEDLLF
jgi:hypothetical protein